MKSKLMFILAVLASFNTYCQSVKDIQPQNHAFHYFIYGDEQYMELEGNKINYSFKEGLNDGLWIGFYDKEYKDTAIAALIVDGQIEHYLFRWDKKDRYIQEITEYKKGKINGIKKSFMLINGVLYENIYRYENNVVSEMIKVEW